jgi:hypothetical protein
MELWHAVDAAARCLFHSWWKWFGLSNSLGIFVDKSGDDRYARNEAQNYGNGAFSRSPKHRSVYWMTEKRPLSEALPQNDSTWVKG